MKNRYINSLYNKSYQDKGRSCSLKELSDNFNETLKSYLSRQKYYPTLEDMKKDIPYVGIFYIPKDKVMDVVQTHHGVHDTYLTSLKGKDGLFLKVYVLEVTDEEAFVIFQDVDLVVDTISSHHLIQGNVYVEQLN